MLPVALGVEVEHHGQPLNYRGSGVTWDGEHEISEARYVCGECGLEVTVCAREHVGPPAAAGDRRG